MILDASGKPIPGETSEPKQRQIEIVRSVSFKLNLGNYESMDFFCSQKAQCDPADADEVSLSLYEWCCDQVNNSVAEVRARRAKKQAQSAERMAG